MKRFIKEFNELILNKKYNEILYSSRTFYYSRDLDAYDLLKKNNEEFLLLKDEKSITVYTKGNILHTAQGMKVLHLADLLHQVINNESFDRLISDEFLDLCVPSCQDVFVQLYLYLKINNLTLDRLGKFSRDDMIFFIRKCILCEDQPSSISTPIFSVAHLLNRDYDHVLGEFILDIDKLYPEIMNEVNFCLSKEKYKIFLPYLL